MNVGLRTRPWAGLDIGEYSVKLLALQPGVAGARHFAAEVPIGHGPETQAIAAEGLARLIDEAFTQAGLTSRSFAGITLGLSSSDVIIKQVQLPFMDDAEVPGALRFEARKHLPFDPATCMIDYQVLGRLPSEKRLEILLAAVPSHRVERALAPLQVLGVQADIVDAAPLALTNALSRGAERDSEARILLDFGLHGSWLTVYQRAAPYFSRRHDFGGLRVTQNVARAARIPLEEAEEWKLEAGSDEPSMRVEPDSAEMVAVHEALHELADELRRSFAFYRTLAPLPDPFSLWISGSTARLPGLGGQLAQLLDVPTFVFDPLDALGADHRGATPAGGPQFAQAYGLALRAA